MIERLLRFKIGKSSQDTDSLLRYLVRSAYTNVPFYRRTWDTEGVSVSQFRGVEDLPLLPIVTKGSLLSRGLQDRLNATVDPQHTIRRGTSGTSGAPIEVHMTRPEFRFRQLILFLALCGNAGWAFPLDIVEAGTWIPPTSSGSVIRRRGLLTAVTYISRKSPLEEQAHALARTRPMVLTGCPSSLQIIAAELVRLRIAPPRPKIIVPRGEVLRPDVRNLLSEVFGGRVIDYYNAQEIGNIARQCADSPSVMYVNHDSCVVEVVDDEGHPVSLGQEGNIVVTSLYNTTMPFLRYTLQDRAVLLQNERTHCRCGCRTQTIASPLGRDDDFIVLPDLQRVSPRVIDDLVIAACRKVGIESSFTRGVQQYQIVQESPTHITLRIAASEPPPASLCTQLVHDVRALHHDFQCDVEEVSQIDLGETGKLKRVLSHLQDDGMAEVAPSNPGRPVQP